MDDRELLELAGLAGNIPKRVIGADGGIYNCDERGWHRNWNPLESDSDALRLVVSLGIDVSFINGDTHADGQSEGGPDKGANTRRAITRAAAEIGRSRET